MSSSSSRLPPVGGEGLGDVSGLAPSAGYPKPTGAALSGWLQSVRHDELLDHGSKGSPPSTADVVIIGSGVSQLSGASIALNLLTSPNAPKSVVMLEARETCSGATGRNAGHCKPDTWRGYSEYKARFGTDQAKKLLNNEKQTYAAVVEYVQKERVDCELWIGQTLDVMMSDSMAKKAESTFAEYTSDGGDVRGIEVVSDPVQAERLSRLEGARSVYAWEAATLHPWKLGKSLAHILRSCFERGLRLHTWTPVSSVTGKESAWRVNTARGTITTPTVIHATNAYVGALLPELIGAIDPVPHMCNRVIPPSSHSGSSVLQHSYAVVSDDGIHTINPRQGGDGALWFGGSPASRQQLVDHVMQDVSTRSTDDGLTNFEPWWQDVRNLGRDAFSWDRPTPGFGVKYDYAWSGIIGQSNDDVPLVGAVPRKPGQWMSCGHSGHGMARIFTISPGLVHLVNGGKWEDTGLPECFEITSDRLRQLRKHVKRSAGARL